MDTNWIAKMFKLPKGPRLRASVLRREITRLAAKLGRPITRGVIDRQSISAIFAEGKLFIEPKDFKEAEFEGVPFTCIDRHPNFPDTPVFGLYSPTV